MKHKYVDEKLEVLLGAGKIIAFKSESDGDTDYILFEDGETYIELSEQDYYSYHDCASSAMHISVYKNKELCKHFMTLPDATSLT